MNCDFSRTFIFVILISLVMLSFTCPRSMMFLGSVSANAYMPFETARAFISIIERRCPAFSVMGLVGVSPILLKFSIVSFFSSMIASWIANWRIGAVTAPVEFA